MQRRVLRVKRALFPVKQDVRQFFILFAISILIFVAPKPEAAAAGLWTSSSHFTQNGVHPRPSTANSTQRAFWQYAAFGSSVGGANILICPTASGVPPEIIVAGSPGYTGTGLSEGDFWHVLRYNEGSGDYDQVFVSPVYTPITPNPAGYVGIFRICLGNVVGDSAPEIIVFLTDGRIFVYDLATKEELESLDTGLLDFAAVTLKDVTGDGYDDFIVTTSHDLYVGDGNSGKLLWTLAGVGGESVVVGQMDNDPALEIATINGNVIDTATRSVQWKHDADYFGAFGFGRCLRLAPFPGENYEQLIVGSDSGKVSSYDVARQTRRWSITGIPDALQVADIDDDGVPELLIGDNQWGSLHVYDLATQTEKWEISNPDWGMTNIAVGDVNGDGIVDLLWGTAHLYIADTVSHTISWKNISLQGPFIGPAIGDLDGDGQPELVVCSTTSEGDSLDGRILVFDLATLKLRGASSPGPFGYGYPINIRDLKLRNVEGNDRMQIVVGADSGGEAVAEIFEFDASNEFTRVWKNSTRPAENFKSVEVADLDGDGNPEVVIQGSHYAYVYDYSSGNELWRSGDVWNGNYNTGIGLFVGDLDHNGTKEIAALADDNDLYTFDAATLQLANLKRATGFRLLVDRVSSSGLIGADSTGVAHFLRYSANSYSEDFSRSFGTSAPDGIHPFMDGTLWVGGAGLLTYFPSPLGNPEWQSPSAGCGVGRFVATDNSTGVPRVFSSAMHAVMGYEYFPLPTTATPAISPGRGSFKRKVTVSLSCQTPNAAIYYTTDGSDPTDASLVYTGPFRIRVPTRHVVKAIAAAPNHWKSSVATAVLRIR